MNTYLIATHSDYTVLVLAKNEQSAINKANKFYKKEYGETRNDWSVYDLASYLSEEGDVMSIHSWWAWEEYLRRNK